MSSDFYFLVPESFNKKFGSDRHSSFWENQVWIFACTWPWAKVKKWPWPSILTYLHIFNKMSAPTNFQVTGCNSFWKIHCFYFFLWKSLIYQIWPCRKISQGHSSIIIWTNYDGLESPMLHTKFRENRPAGSGEEDFWRVFTIYGRGGHLGHVTQMPRTNFRSPYPRRLHIKFGFDRASSFGEKDVWNCLRRTTTTDDGRTPDHQYPISSP